MRLVAFVVGAVALAGTGAGVYWASADSNPQGLSDAALNIAGRPPTSMTGTFDITTDQQNSITGTFSSNLQSGASKISLSIPLIFSTSTYYVEVVDGKVYVGAPSLSSVLGASWFSYPVKEPSLYAASAFLQDGKLITDELPTVVGAKSVTTQGPFTTYHFTRSAPLETKALEGTLGVLGIHLPTHFHTDTAITLASQGQISGASFTITGKGIFLQASVTVTSYDQPVTITPPPANQVHPLSENILQKVFGSAGVTTLSGVESCSATYQNGTTCKTCSKIPGAKPLCTSARAEKAISVRAVRVAPLAHAVASSVR
jgi:hypothetical protein